MASNEEALCEALISLFESELNARRWDTTYPEKDHSGPPVEIRVRLGPQRFAIEHTLIEPFPSAILSGKWFAEFSADIQAALSGSMPTPGIYQLIFPIDPMRGKPRDTHKALRERIIQWVRQAGEELHGECPARQDRNHRPFGYRGSRQTVIDGIPLTLSLRVHWAERGHHDGTLFLVRSIDDNIEDQRQTRLRTALDKKLPKLAACRAEGDITMLILEYSDIALTNHVLVAHALEAELADRESPDHIFIVDTTNDDKWSFFQVVTDRRFSIEVDFIEIAPPNKVVLDDAGTPDYRSEV